jgi:HK97 family phage prohead protease
METERRIITVDMRAAGDAENPVIEGDAAVFNQETKISTWFREMIKPGAFKRVLSEHPDVVAAYNHDWNYILGRTTAGTLSLKETDKSLEYKADINPKDMQAMSVYEKVKRGDVTQASFAFTVRTEEWTKPADKSQLALRSIVEIDQLFDVGPVAFGAYPQASASARSQALTLQETETPSDQAASSGAEELERSQQARRRQVEFVERSIYISTGEK